MKPGINLQSGEARNCFAVKLLTLGILKKNIFVCFNGLYTPFGSPVIGGQKRLLTMLPDDRRLFVLVALRPAYRAPENDFISFRPKSPRYACAKCMQPTSQELCRMRTTLWLGSIWTEDDESSLLISDGQRVPGRAKLAHSQIVFFRVFRVFRCYLKKSVRIREIFGRKEAKIGDRGISGECPLP